MHNLLEANEDMEDYAIDIKQNNDYLSALQKVNEKQENLDVGKNWENEKLKKLQGKFRIEFSFIFHLYSNWNWNYQKEWKR